MGRLSSLSKYTPELREEAVRLHREQGGSVAETARRLGHPWAVGALTPIGLSKHEHLESCEGRRRVEEGERKLRVSKIGPSPPPGDRRKVRLPPADVAPFSLRRRCEPDTAVTTPVPGHSGCADAVPGTR